MTSPDENLAIHGGPPVRPEGPPSWPTPDEDVRLALEKAYRDGTWGRYFGPNLKELEDRLAAYFDSTHAVTCSSGTLAVELALRALNVGAGDEVIMAGYDYLGNFLGIHAVGALPVLVDVAPRHWNLDVSQLENAFTEKTRAVLVSHLHGGVVEMLAVMELAKSRGVPVIEDAAQMPGAVLAGRKVGAFGDLGIVSFGGSKLLSAGRGGAIVTSDSRLHQRLRSLLQRGNNLLSPISELQATVLLPQLAKLDERTRHREKNVAFLRDRLASLATLRLFTNPGADVLPGYYKLGMQLEIESLELERKFLVQAMRAEGIAIDEGFAAVHMGRSPSRYRKSGDLTNVEAAHRGAMVLHHPILLGTRLDMEQIALAFEKIARYARQQNGTES